MTPSGTLTFLFTDIEGSTRRWDLDSVEMSTALARHDDTLRTCIQEFGGTVFKMVGDGCCAAFATAPEALRAAIEIQTRLRSGESEGDALRVRTALHTGVAEERDGDYFGPPVNRVARLLATAHGGQIVLSLATHELVRDRVPAGSSLVDLGEHRLKDLIRPEHIFQVANPALDNEFPALRSLGSRPTNLPIQATGFIGREKEVGEVCETLRESGGRLVTLTGPAGTGKTRLGLQVGAELVDEFRDGVFFVSLAPLARPELVVPAIVAALGVREAPDMSASDVLKGYLRDKDILLILDNFEHVMAAAGEIGEIGQECRRLKVLITSRTAVQLYGERRYPVPSMPVPDRDHLPSLSHLSQYESVALFIQRARGARPDFVVTNETAPSLAEICARLDGLPLAIELAAARVGMLSLPAILDRLSSRLTLLTTGASNMPARQRTLRGAIEWSYELLAEPEQRLYRSLGVFHGGWTLEAAEGICNAGQDMDVFDSLSSLIEKSLIRSLEHVDPRFDMLETLREYAQDQLGADGLRELNRLHAEYYLAYVSQTAPEFVGQDQSKYLGLVLLDLNNIRAAMRYWVDQGDGDRSRLLCQGLYEFWLRRGLLSEGMEFLRAALTTEPGDAGLQEWCLASAGFLLTCLDLSAAALVEARQLLTESRTLATERGDRYAQARASYLLSDVELTTDADAAVALAQEATELARSVGHIVLTGQSLGRLSYAWTAKGEYQKALDASEEALAIAHELEDPWDLALSMYEVGHLHHMLGNNARAREIFAASITILESSGNDQWARRHQTGLGRIAFAEGRYEEAVRHFQVGIAATHEMGMSGVSVMISALASAFASAGDVSRAIRIWSAAERLRGGPSVAFYLGPDEDRRLAERMELVRAEVGQAAWDLEWERGQALTADEMVRLAVTDSS